MRRSASTALTGLAALLALSGCGAVTERVAPTAETTRTVQVSGTFGTEPGTAVTYDQKLVPVGAQGAVDATETDGGTTVTLSVQGLLPGRSYGAHVHTQPCGATGADAGPHYQNTVDPVQPSVDPLYANPDNEIWLDLTTDDTGAGTARTAVTWAFNGDRRAHSVVVHAMSTATDPGHAGTAGSRAACITVGF